MIGLPYSYGVEETVGLHIILSNLFWWSSLILVIKAYGNRQIWNVGDTPWTFLFFTFLFFGIRELGHLSTSTMVGTLRYILGIWSAIFMTTAFLYLFFIIYKRKKVPDKMIYLPFALALLFPALLLYLWFSGTSIENIKNTMSSLENLIWICGSSITIYTTYLIGTRSTGGFVYVFMLFQFAALASILWKCIGLISSISCPVPYSIREIIETLFGIFAISAMYILTKMLVKLSKDIS